MKAFYILVCIVGTILPYSQFLPWLSNHGLNLSQMLGEIVNSRISAFAWSDVVISALVLITFIVIEGRRLNMNKLWLPILGTLSVGVSLGFPLFLLMREIHNEQA